MQENNQNITNSKNTQVNNTATQIEQKNIQKPKQNSFLIVLLSILLFVAIMIAGFFAYQTQKLVKELQEIRSEELVSPTPVVSTRITTDSMIECKSSVLGLSLKLPNNIWKCQDHEKGYTLTATSDIFNIQISSLGRGVYCEPPIRDPQSPRYDPTSPDEVCEVTTFYSQNGIILNQYKSYGKTKEIFGQIKNGPSISVTYSNMESRDLSNSEKLEIIKILDSVVIK